MSNEVEIVTRVGVISLDGVYTIAEGYHEGKKIKVTYISPDRTIFSAGKQYRMVEGKLLNSSAKINTMLELLWEYKDSKKINYNRLNQLELIRRCKRGDKKAVVEFIRRFKKKPKL